MIKSKVIYKDNRRLFKKKRKKVMHIPTTYRELNTEQVFNVLIIMTLLNKSIDTDKLDPAVRINFLKSILSIEDEIFYKLKKIEIYEYLELVEQIYSSDLWETPIREIHTEDQVLLMPQPRMETSTFGEFVMAEEYYTNILEGEDVKKNKILITATLCRERDYKYLVQINPPKDQRKPMDTSMRDEIVEALEKIDFRYIEYVFFFYRNTRSFLISYFDSVWSNEDTEPKDIDFTSKYRWRMMLDQISEKGVFGDWEKTANQNLYNVLDHISMSIDKSREEYMKSLLK